MNRFCRTSYSVHRSLINQTNKQTINRTRYQSVNESIETSNNEHDILIAPYSIIQPVNHTNDLPIEQPLQKPIHQSLEQFQSPGLRYFELALQRPFSRFQIRKSNQSVRIFSDLSINRPIKQSVNSSYHSIDHSSVAEQAIEQPIERINNQILDLVNNQTIDQSSVQLGDPTRSQTINQPDCSVIQLNSQLLNQADIESVITSDISEMPPRPQRARKAVNYDEQASKQSNKQSDDDQSMSPVKLGRKRKSKTLSDDEQSIDESINEVIATEITEELTISASDKSIKQTVKKTVKKAKVKAASKSTNEDDDESDDKPAKAAKKSAAKAKKVKQPPALDGIFPIPKNQSGNHSTSVSSNQSKDSSVDLSLSESLNLSSKKFVGGHVSAAGGVHFAVYNAAKTGARAFAFDLKSKRRWASAPMEQSVIDSFHQLINQYKYNRQAIVPHGSYLINLGSLDDELYEKSKACIKDELERCQLLGIKKYVFHPGSSCAVKKSKDAKESKKSKKEDEDEDDEEEEEEEQETEEQPTEQSIAQSNDQSGKNWVPPAGSNLEISLRRLIDALDWVCSFESCNQVRILIETMAGQGSCLAARFEEIAYVIQRVKQPNRIGVCIDTCHMFAAGYDLRSPDAYEAAMEKLDQTIGFEFIQAAHLNDSMCGLSSRRDRHQNIGDGLIGARLFHCLMNDSRWDGIPLILETPCMPFDESGSIDKTIKVPESKKDWVKSYREEIGILYSYENEPYVDQPPRQPVVELVSKAKAAKAIKEAAKNTKSITSFFKKDKQSDVQSDDADENDEEDEDEKPKKRTSKPKVSKAKPAKAKAASKKKTSAKE